METKQLKEYTYTHEEIKNALGITEEIDMIMEMREKLIIRVKVQ